MDLPHKQRAFFPFSDLKKDLNNRKEVRLDIRQTLCMRQFADVNYVWTFLR